MQDITFPASRGGYFELASVRLIGSRATNSIAAIVLVVGAITGLAGCASYQPLPLSRRPALALSPDELKVTIPATAIDHSPHRIDIGHSLTIDQIGLLAILNDPDLKSERGEIDIASAGVLQATLLPNPTGNLGYGALVSGPGTTSSIAASLSQDIAAIVTRGARVQSAKAHLYQVDADRLWREWLVAQKARQLAVDISSAARAIGFTARENQLLRREIVEVKGAISAGNLTLAALAPLLSAEAAAEQSLVILRLSRLKNWQSLDALLGLDPSVRLRIARPVFRPLPRNFAVLVSALPERRPDLIALRLGYQSAQENVRAAILGQFPALAVGGSYSSDTSAVVSAGPDVTFSLPIFDRNQGHIAKAEATRLLLREQYQARLDKAVAHIRALIAQLRQLSSNLKQARVAAAAARSLASTAQRAYEQHNLDQRSLTDYERTALERAVEVVTIERQIGEDRIVLAVELGLGLPQTRMTLSGETQL